MKKLLVLLVLAMATIASAAPVWTLTHDAGVITVSVVDNPGAPINLVMAMQTSEGTLSNFVKGPNAPADSALIGDVGDNFPDLGDGEIWAMAHLTTGTLVYLDGDWLSFDVTLAGATGTVSLYEYIEADGTTPFITSIFIPEPATIALLCLGGLLIRKK